MLIAENDDFVLEEENSSIYLTVKHKGCSFLQIHQLIVQDPRYIVDVKNINDALTAANGTQIHIGQKKPLIEWKIPSNYLSASIKLNCTNEYLQQNYSEIVSQLMKGLHEQNIMEGILIDVIQNKLIINEHLVIAKGKEPIPGKDAVITYYKRIERKPTIREDGKADYYDMNFLDEVKKGDWLGEKIPFTNSSPGRTITGEWVIVENGKNKKLQYDQKTVAAYEEDGKMVLRSLVDGVVEFQAGKISVGNHLVIDGDVGIETGNIKFDGNITVKGTVMDGYSIVASRDISILGEMGVSKIDIIQSKFGDVYIKGGIFGKGKSRILAGRNIFVKHTNESILEAGDNIHIGYYSLGSHLKAKNIMTDEQHGKLIGGVIEARGKVRTGVIGNSMERKTFIHVLGFNREQLKEELHDTLIHYKTKMEELEIIKEKMNVFDIFTDELNFVQLKQYERITYDFERITKEIFDYDEKRKSLMDTLDSKGDGEISVGQMAYPDTNLQIKNMKKKLSSISNGTFFAHNNDIHFEH